jgi:putative ABC transport system permease protein
MFTNVLERKKEIGIMKAIGASPKDIKYMFIVEAGLMGLVGGIIGVILGSIISFSIGKVAEQSGFMLLSIHVDYWVIFLGVAFAFIVGMISGYVPANRASKLTPVEALKE